MKNWTSFDDFRAGYKVVKLLVQLLEACIQGIMSDFNKPFLYS